MCILELTRDVTFIVIQNLGDYENEPEFHMASFCVGDRLDVGVYETGGARVSIQFADGSISREIPGSFFRVVSTCPLCEDVSDLDAPEGSEAEQPMR